MFIDLRTLDSGAEFETDICIAGAGAAGIALALAFLDTRANVYLLESGGLDIEAETQALYEGENAGRDYYPLDVCRLRFFGGTTNHWGGRSQPLSAWDFAARPWVPHSGWPIGLEDLEPYYRHAQHICGLGPFLYGPEVWRHLGFAAPEIDPQRLRYAFWRYSWQDSNARRADDTTDNEPVQFGTEYRDALSRAPNVRVLLYANVTKVRLDPTGRTVEAFEIRSLTGTSASIGARCYVLACGAIENARLLLLSDDVEPNGVGNRHDLVGRFFMEHPDAECGIVQPTGSPLAVRTFRLHALDGRTVRPGVLLAPELQAREQVLGCATTFGHRLNAENPTVVLHGIYRDFAAGRWPDGLGPELAAVLADLDSLAGDVYRWLTGGRPAVVERVKHLAVTAELEQAPSPDSRVTLADGRDALGLRQTRLTWRLTELDKHSLLVFTKVIGAEFGRLGLGRVRIADWLLDGSDTWGGDMHGSFHHLGTTRMADDPKRGVVDRDCRVHGIDNLYAAGGSVFPTAGPSNPTLTIVALALRLADHLKAHSTRVADRADEEGALQWREPRQPLGDPEPAADRGQD